MLGIWNTSRAMRAANDIIKPLVNHSRARLGLIPNTAWRDPYILGFMSMLITLVADQQTEGRINTDQLGQTQMRAFHQITGAVDDQIGEQICLLSANGDEKFMGGCRNAVLFLNAYNGAHNPIDPDVAEIIETTALDKLGQAELSPDEVETFGRGGIIAAALWQRYFDDQFR